MADIQLALSGKEYFVKEEDFLTSKTDVKGIIKYANKPFIAISGFTEAELVGAAHNIVRHPDMPRGVFKIMWDHLKSAEEVFAFVKNRAKDGGFYWVFANVTPSFDETGKMVGYYSVRRRPNPEALKYLSKVYSEMLNIEKKHKNTREAAAASSEWLLGVIDREGTHYNKFIFSLQ